MQTITLLWGVTNTQVIMEEYFKYLNDLRDSGLVNMYGASYYLRWEFPDLTKIEARKILSAWMNQFE